MENEKSCGCPWSTTGATLPITGCRFSLAPMSDKYIDYILSAIEKTDTSKIWSKTDKTSTVYRGKKVHVIDSVKACFMNAYDENIHMTAELTFSKGCPGDSDGDSFLSEDDTLLNEPNLVNKNFNVVSKISFYPLGTTDYMQGIIDVVNMAKDFNLYLESSHYCTILEGDIHKMFQYFESVLSYADENISHYVFQGTLSVNSPTK